MGSASREALAAVKSTLKGRLLAASVGAELLSASAVIDGAPALRGALADSSVDAAEKIGVVDRLFRAFAADTRGLLSEVVSQTWSNPDELVAGIEELGLRVEAITDEGLADELLAAATAIDSSHELELALGNKLGAPDAKGALVEKIFGSKLSKNSFGIVRHIVVNPRGRRVSAALRHSAHIAADQGGAELATVTAAAPLSASQLDKLEKLLETSSGRAVRLTTVVDPAVVGGIRIQIGDDVIDGSVRSRLDDLRLQLAG